MRLTNLRTVFALVLLAVCLAEVLLVTVLWFKDKKDLSKERKPALSGTIKPSRLSAVTKKPRRNDSAEAAPGHGSPQQDKPAPKNNLTESPSFDLDKVIQDLARPWLSNETRKGGLRSKLNNRIDAREYTVLTQKFTAVGQNITFAINDKVSRSLTKEVFQLLPKESPFVNQTLERCSVVGNGGILAGSYCGREIDKSDFVFRCNTAPLKGYQWHAGTMTNLTSINPGGVISSKYKRLSDPGHRKQFLADVKQYGDLLLPAYGVNVHAYTASMLALRLLKQSKSSTRALVINPYHFRGLQEFWRKMGLKQRMTTGFYFASVALSVCNSTHLYGFWPFPTDTHHQPVAYHYYDKQNITKGVHNFNWEFDMLYQLHMNGVLQLHVGTCE